MAAVESSQLEWVRKPLAHSPQHPHFGASFATANKKSALEHFLNQQNVAKAALSRRDTQHPLADGFTGKRQG